MDNNNEEPLQSRVPSEEELFYIDWGKETVKNNIEIAQGVLTQFLTLNTALMGGSAVFLAPETISKICQSFALASFFMGLFFSFLGILPHENVINSSSPSEIKKHKESALKSKRIFMWLSAVSTAVGLIAVSIGVIIVSK